MSGMFRGAWDFNQDIGNWDISSVTDMSAMFSKYPFYYRSPPPMAFNQDINTWNVSSVTSMSSMFEGFQGPFNQPLNSWDVSSVTDMSGMFQGAKSFNQAISNWDVSSVTTMEYMFSSASDFNQPLNTWDMSSVTVMSHMFKDASDFNQPLNSWDVSSATDMSSTFNGASNFNQLIGSWDVSSVTGMGAMFWGASDFNQPLNSWDVSSVNYMHVMFAHADSFNQDISNWNVSRVKEMSQMFDGVALSISNYDALLLGWSELSLQRDVIFDAGNSVNSIASSDARQKIIDEFNWIIYDASNPQPEEISETQTEVISETQTEETSETQPEETSESLDRVIIGGSLAVLLIAGLGGYMVKVRGLSRIAGVEVNESTKIMLQHIFNGNTNKYLYLVGGVTRRDGIKTETNIPKEMLNHKFLMQPVRLAMMKVLTENPYVTKVEMKNTLEISWGELSNNLIALRKHNLILTEERFIDGNVRQAIVVTPEGLSKYNNLVKLMQEFLASPDYENYVDDYSEKLLTDSDNN